MGPQEKEEYVKPELIKHELLRNITALVNSRLIERPPT